MFSRQKNAQTDIKKSTIKLLDSKKDLATRLKHLKLILETVDSHEAKTLFATYYSHVYHLVYEGVVCAEGSLKLRGGFLTPTLSLTLSDSLPFSLAHRAQREELESVLQLLERVLMLLPDLLHCRWQLHSMSRLMAKLNHPGNSMALRKQSIRLFIMWYQCLGTAAPAYVHSMFAALVPGLPGATSWPPAGDSSWGISAYEITPVLPASPGERQPEDPTSYFLELLLDFMVSQAPKIHWNEGSQMWTRSIEFLYERFKELYLPRIFHDFQVNTDIFKPHLELPEPRKSADLSNNVISACQVVFVKWIANYAHSVYRPMDYAPQQQAVWNSNPTPTVQMHQHDDARTHSTPPSSLGDRDSITSYSSINNDVDANVIAKDVILGSRANINFLHEVFRRALLMNFVHTVAIRRVICVYKDWIQMNVPELPVFMLEPEEGAEEEVAGSLEPPKNRLRTDSYYGAVGINANNNREEYLSHLRAGAQKVLQVFFCNSASVFLLFQIPKHEAAMAFLEEQVDICKRVLNIYRYAVMNTRMNANTWEQLLVVLLHVTSKVLDTKQLHFGVKNPDSLGAKLASALFQTLIVSWVKASLNVPISTELWDQLQSVLSQLTFCDDLITEWSKTMETLTRVLSRHVYNLDLANLPLDRLSEQKSKKRRPGVGSQPAAVVKEPLKRSSDVPDGLINRRDRHTSTGNSSDRKSMIFSPVTPLPKRKLKRSLSDGNIAATVAVSRNGGLGGGGDDISLGNHSIGGAPVTGTRAEHLPDNLTENRTRKKSRSMDSLRRIASHFGHIGQPGALNSDWAEISSSTASLENASTIHIDGDVNSIDCGGDVSTKTEVKGVISGGTVKGWLPSVAGILWRRMLGILGNVNEFTNPKTHAHFFQVLSEIWNTLHKISQNQGVSLDNLSTPKPPELTPPLTCFATWCFQAFDLPDEYYRGRVLALALLCDTTMANQNIPFTQEYLTKFYAVIHKTIIANQQEMINEIIRKCGYRFMSKMLPGFSLLLLDLSQASHSVLTSEDLKKAPRMEAATILGLVLTISDVCKELPILKPNVTQFQPITAHPTKDVVFSCLLQFSKTEQTSHARVICLQSLTTYLCRELMDIRHSGLQSSRSVERCKRIGSIFAVLLASVKVVNRSVALVSSDLLLLLADFATEISTYFGDLIPKIILGLKWSLQQALPLKNSSWTSGKPVETEKRFLISLMLTLGEWCMKLPVDIMLSTDKKGKPSLFSSVFEALHMAVKGFQSAGVNDVGNLNSLEDFDSNIPFDDLQTVDPSIKGSGRENGIRPESTNSNSPHQNLETVRLAAKTLLMHLLTQTGHFPITNGSSRCGSIVSENDDLPGLNAELDELNTYIFSLPNVQMFAINNNTLMSIVELPAQDCPGGGVTAGFVTSPFQVRIILRDLSGKAAYDAAHLYAPPSAIKPVDENPTTLSSLPHHQTEDLFYLSAMTGNFLPQLGPRLTVRRRGAGILPTAKNSADDMDNLDDLLSYVGYTSPECLLRIGEPLSTPWKPPSTVTQENEDDVVSAVVNQRNSELEFLMKFDMDSTMRAMPISTSMGRPESETDVISEQGDMPSLAASTRSMSTFGSNFMLSRRFFSQLGFTGWDKRSTVDILQKDERLLRELKHLDSQKCRETHKIAVIYVAEGQEDKHSILSNTGGSEIYEDFVAGLGWEVELETHTGFMGGLQRNKSSGETAPYYATSFTEVIFHVSTRMPSSTEENLLQKTRHLGNDEIHIVWSEHSRDYRRDIIPTEFCDVLIVIYPLQFGLFRIQISRKPEVPYFGPLFNEAIVERDVLAILVRATAINASRAKRSSLQYFQHHFEEREKSLSTIIKNHKSRTTFEGFASNVFCPIFPPPSFAGTSNRASVSSFSSSSRMTSSTITANSVSSSNQLSAALLLDSTVLSGNRRGPYHDVPFSSPEVKSGRSSGFGGGESSSSIPESPPVPPKKLSIKLGSGLKPKLHTPPASPIPPNRTNPNSAKHN